MYTASISAACCTQHVVSNLLNPHGHPPPSTLLPSHYFTKKDGWHTVRSWFSNCHSYISIHFIFLPSTFPFVSQPKFSPWYPPPAQPPTPYTIPSHIFQSIAPHLLPFLATLRSFLTVWEMQECTLSWRNPTSIRLKLWTTGLSLLCPFFPKLLCELSLTYSYLNQNSLLDPHQSEQLQPAKAAAHSSVCSAAFHTVKHAILIFPNLRYR